MHQNYEDGDYPSLPDPDSWDKNEGDPDLFLDELNRTRQSPKRPMVQMARDALAYHDHLQNQETGQYISKDDILNLRIDLETTGSVQEFLWATK
jgi:hypothetical protein